VHKAKALPSACPALCLPVELWARVFDLLKPKSDYAAKTTQTHLHQLRLVCTKFSLVFAQHPNLSDHLRYFASGNNALPSLLVWIHKVGYNVKSFISCCDGPQQDVVLGALVSASSKLELVVLENISSTSVQLLAACFMVTRCRLYSCVKDLDLSMLQKLPHLQEMTLSTGDFTGVPLTAQLTYLDIEDCKVSFTKDLCDAPKLQNLIFHYSHVYDLYETGLSGCSSLTQLALIDCTVTGTVAGSQVVVGEDSPTFIPASISALILLEKLELELGLQPAIEWFYGLSLLRHLDLWVGNSVTFSPCVTQLKHLTNFQVTADYHENEDFNANFIAFEFDWRQLRMLKHLVLSGPLTFTQNISGITELEDLAHVSLIDILPGDVSTAGWMAALAYALATHRPLVSFHVGDKKFPIVQGQGVMHQM